MKIQMAFYYHVTQKEPHEGLFRLAIPTYHAEAHMQGIDKEAYLRSIAKVRTPSSRELELFRLICGPCPVKQHCLVHNTYHCHLVTHLLSKIEWLNHRAQQFVEYIFECERQAHFPHLPSRFNVLFCWESLDDAKWFREQLRGGKGHIYEVTPKEPNITIHRGDIQWLNCLLSPVQEIHRRAHAYWNGECCGEPGGGRCEILVPDDLRVLRKID